MIGYMAVAIIWLGGFGAGIIVGYRLMIRYTTRAIRKAPFNAVIDEITIIKKGISGYLADFDLMRALIK